MAQNRKNPYASLKLSTRAKTTPHCTKEGIPINHKRRNLTRIANAKSAKWCVSNWPFEAVRRE